ncbi:MAG TPA: glycosyl hydrolase family 28 protein [Chitinophagaceae bacterium]|nr:glycosyl hydrolase family 28 protein [Chitinophagaceae bacterium]
MAAFLRKFIIATIISVQFLQAYAKDYPASLFGINSDGVTLNTRSIQFAIDYVNQQGGGRLVFDVGRFLTGSIHLKSNVTILLKEGAVLLGVLNPLDYERDGFTALVLARDQQNIAITGAGIIDGQGRQVANNVSSLVHKGLIKDAFRNDRPEVEIRPMLIYFRNCSNVLIKGITLRNGAAWIQTYDQCKKLNIDSLTVDSRAFWNNDGMDIVDCDSVSISNSYIDADDDGICLKSHDPKMVCQNILIRNCTIRSSASAIKFGTASLGGFRNIKIINIKVFDTYRSAIALEAVDGGFIENVEADSLQVRNTGNAIFLRIGERVAGKKGRLENIKFNHLSIEIAGNKPDSGYEYEGPIENMPRNISPAIVIAGLPGAIITNVSFKNIEIKHPGGGNPFVAKILPNDTDSVPEKSDAYPEFSMFRELPTWGIYIRHARDVEITGLSLQCSKKDYRTAIVLDDVHHSRFLSMNIKEPGSKNSFSQNHSTEISFK